MSKTRLILSVGVVAALPLAAVATWGLSDSEADSSAPRGFALPAGCRVASAASEPEGRRTWTVICEDAEHVLAPFESQPLLASALADAGWSLCGAAGGTAYFRDGDRITTLAMAVDDRRGPTFGEIYLGQKPRTVECR